MDSVKPLWIAKDYSRYSLELIGSPSKLSNLSEKSRTTQRKVGKYLANSSGSASSNNSLLIYSSLERLMISCRLFSAFSSMVPILLYMKKELRRRAKRKILVS